MNVVFLKQFLLFLNSLIMHILRTKNELRAWVSLIRAERKTISFVPTMGALHDGHLSLVRLGTQRCHHALVSIFVNPSQFAPHEDFDAYPRTLEEDLKQCEKAGATAVYAPGKEDVYPEGFQTQVSVSKLKLPLEGVFRPHFFDGVATVVTKLLLQVLPDIAIFGEKDYQQLQVIYKLVEDLDIPVTILGAPTVRESDGLAMSSRNRYLSASDRTKAAALYQVLGQARKEIFDGKDSFSAILERAKENLKKAGFTAIDYVECCDAKTLETATSLGKPLRILAAAKLGNTRLIDNIAV